MGIPVKSIVFLKVENNLLLQPIRIQWWHHNIFAELLLKDAVHASVYEFCLVLSFWSELQPLLITSCVQSISLILATITKIMNVLSFLSEDLEREIECTESMFFILTTDLMLLGRTHLERLKAILYTSSRELSQFSLSGNKRVDLEFLIT